jgi:hypothetical protein
METCGQRETRKPTKVSVDAIMAVQEEQLISDLNGVGENVALKIWNNHDKNDSIEFKLKKMYEMFLMN